MLLDLRDEDQHRIDTIELTDGCFPRITIDIGAFGHDLATNSQTPKEEYYVTNLEPAVWSIILILDRICVDCTKRRVLWTTRGTSETEDHEGTNDAGYRTQYQEDECYDYNDDVDELFSLAHELIKLSKSRTSTSNKPQDYLNCIKEEQYSLIRMLYCYILPKVQIYKEDLPKVEEALTKQLSYIQKIDKDIERDSITLDKLYEALHHQQDLRLDKFEKLVAEGKCSKRFLKSLEKDLNKRKDQLNQQLDQQQTVVNAIKEDINTNGETVEKVRQLKEARKQSAIYNQKLQKVLVVLGDAVKTALSEETFSDGDCEEIVLDYLKCVDMAVKQKNTANNQMDKKVRATSILANLKCIKQEIETHGVNSNSGQSATHVFPERYAPEYQTLSERVSAIVKNHEHPLGFEFQKFVSIVRERCKEIMNHTDMVEFQRKRKTKMTDNYILVDADGTFQLEFKSTLEDLAATIKNHFFVMAASLQDHFNSGSNVLRNKLQLCYEENFYNTVGKDISNIYCKAYEHQKQKMVNDLKVITKLPINCLELGMKEEWWLDLFEKRRKVIATSCCSSCENIHVLTGSSSYARSPETVSSSSSGSPGSSGSSMSAAEASPTCKPRRNRSSRIRESLISLIRRKSSEVTRTVGEACNGTDTNFNEIHTDPHNGVCNGHHSPFATRVEWSDYANDYQEELSKFEKYFGPSLESLKNMFEVSAVFRKLQCFTSSLRHVTHSVQELRRQVLRRSASDDDDVSLAITGDDILPLIVLMILQMDPNDAASLQSQLKMMQDLIPSFLSAGCHGWAMMEFQMACQVLLNLCRDFSWEESFDQLGTSNRH